MPRSVVATLILLLSPVLLPSAGSANPRLSTYVTSGTLTTSVQGCLDQMKGVANQAGFSASQEVVIDKNGKAGDFHSDNSTASLHFTARCNSVSNTWAMAVSGTNASKTFLQFQAIANSIYNK